MAAVASAGGYTTLGAPVFANSRGRVNASFEIELKAVIQIAILYVCAQRTILVSRGARLIWIAVAIPTATSRLGAGIPAKDILSAAITHFPVKSYDLVSQAGSGH